MKICRTCKVEKSDEDFKGRQVDCKDCMRKRRSRGHHSIGAVIADIYRGQIARSRQRGHDLPDYNLIWLRDWLKGQPLFSILYNKWVDADFDKWEKPSVDRIDDYKGYTKDNIQLMSWRENSDKAKEDRVTGKNNKASRAVVGTDKDGVDHYFHSMHEAERRTGALALNISNICNGVRGKTAKGYKWRYADEHEVKNEE